MDAIKAWLGVISFVGQHVDNGAQRVGVTLEHPHGSHDGTVSCIPPPPPPPHLHYKRMPSVHLKPTAGAFSLTVFLFTGNLGGAVLRD